MLFGFAIHATVVVLTAAAVGTPLLRTLAGILREVYVGIFLTVDDSVISEKLCDSKAGGTIVPPAVRLQAVSRLSHRFYASTAVQRLRGRHQRRLWKFA